MILTPIKTRVLVPPQDDLLSAITETIPHIEERSILAVTSKVVSIWEGRCVSKETVPDKDALIIREADQYLPRDLVPEGWVMHTIKNNLFIPSAGIDESNANEHYILWPKNPNASAKKIYDWAREAYGVRDLGIIITDSHTIPLRRGTVGISLSHYGFAPMNDYRGTPDLFGRMLKITLIDIADGLAAAAVVAMGEGGEATPLALITDFPAVQFTDPPLVSNDPHSSFNIPKKEDLYYPLLSCPPWREGGKGVDMVQ